MLVWICSQLIIGFALGTMFRVPILIVAFLLVFAESAIVAVVLESNSLMWHIASGIVAVQIGYALGSLLRNTLIEIFVDALRHQR